MNDSALGEQMSCLLSRLLLSAQTPGAEIESLFLTVYN